MTLKLVTTKISLSFLSKSKNEPLPGIPQYDHDLCMEPDRRGMASSLSEVEENLNCPLCLDLFKDPVVLSCSHSFCSVCLERCVGENARQCPLCRKQFKQTPCKILVLGQISEVVAKKRKVLEQDQGVCLVHGEEFGLFCIDDQKLICSMCVSWEHNYHNFCSIDRAVEEHRVNIASSSKVRVLHTCTTCYSGCLGSTRHAFSF